VPSFALVNSLQPYFSIASFLADCVANRAKSGEGGYSVAVGSWRKGAYTSYTPDSSEVTHHPGLLEVMFTSLQFVAAMAYVRIGKS